jgi:hypothetical protein
MTHGRGLLVLSLFGLSACAACAANPSASRESGVSPQQRVTTAECYALTYTDAVGGASARLFPAWLMLQPGADSGGVVGRSIDDKLLKYSGWKSIGADSLEVLFTGGFEGIRFRVTRSDTGLSGRATWLTDLVGLPEASMRVAGTTAPCA